MINKNNLEYENLDIDFLKTYINQKYLNEKELKKIKKEFLNAKPFEHISLNEFLNEDIANTLFKSLEYEEYYLEDSDLYQFFRTYDFKNTNVEEINKFRNFLMDKRTINFFEYFTNSKINPKIFDMHSLKLLNTHYLLCHDDVVLGREFALIFNLTKDWSKECGGELELFENENGKIINKSIKIAPKFNQMNIFKVQKTSYHQIREVLCDKKRITIGCWYHY